MISVDAYVLKILGGWTLFFGERERERKWKKLENKTIIRVSTASSTCIAGITSLFWVTSILLWLSQRVYIGFCS